MSKLKTDMGTVSAIAKITSKVFNVPVAKLQAPSRRPDIFFPRWTICYVAAWWGYVEAGDIAMWLCCTRAAVHRALRNIETDMKNDPKFNAKVQAVIKAFETEYPE